MSADNAGNAVAVGDRQRLDAELGCLFEQFLARARAAQERKMRGALQLSIACRAHPKIPCRNQWCEPVAVSSPLPAR
jgi:hypothetical protein